MEMHAPPHPPARVTQAGAAGPGFMWRDQVLKTDAVHGDPSGLSPLPRKRGGRCPSSSQNCAVLAAAPGILGKVVQECTVPWTAPVDAAVSAHVCAPYQRLAPQ